VIPRFGTRIASSSPARATSRSKTEEARTQRGFLRLRGESCKPRGVRELGYLKNRGDPIPIGVNLLAAASANGWTPVAFDFKVHGLQKGEAFSLDGIYVDPWASRN
jgi:hypothetical protein